MTKRNKRVVIDQNDKGNHALKYRGKSTKPPLIQVDAEGEKRIWGLSVRLMVLAACFVSGFGFMMLYFTAANEMKNVTATNYTQFVNSEFNIQNYSIATDRVNVRYRPSMAEFIEHFDCQL